MSDQVEQPKNIEQMMGAVKISNVVIKPTPYVAIDG